MDYHSQPPFQPQASLEEFFAAFDIPRVVDSPDLMTSAQRFNLALDLIHEEYTEVMDATEGDDGLAFVKELADLVYVCFYAAVSTGIDLERVFRTVHGSNMSKLGPDGKAIRRDDGKILKGPHYRPPDLGFILPSMFYEDWDL